MVGSGEATCLLGGPSPNRRADTEDGLITESPMEAFRTVSISELTPGSVLVTPVFDENRIKLLNCGTRIDEHLIDHLRQRGVREVQIESAAEKIVDVKGDAQRCHRCKSYIDIKPPRPELAVTIWLCKSCGLIYFGSDEQEAALRGLSRADHKNANPFETANGTVRPSIPPENAKSLARLLTEEEITWADRRRHKRYPVTVGVLALPLGPDFHVKGEPVPVTTLNVSLGGAALLYTRFVDAPSLAVDFSKAGLNMPRVVFKVVRRRNLGPVYEIGGQFISRLS